MSDERDGPPAGSPTTPGFLDKVAHDIRGPAGVTLGALDELELSLGAELVAKHGVLLGMARRGAQKVLKVADLLSQTAEQGRASALPCAPAPLVSSAKPDASARVKVLVVDDDDDAVDLLALTLEQAGFDPLVAHNLEEARNILATQSPTALITDLRLPDGGGLETARFPGAERLRAKFVASGHDDPERKRQTLQAGFQEHLVKPVDSVLLVSLLKRHLART